MTKILVICTCTPDAVSSHHHGSSIWSFILLNGLLEIAEITLLTPGLPQGPLHNPESLHIQETQPSCNMGRIQRAWKSIRYGFIPVMLTAESKTVIRSLEKLESSDFDACILLDDYAAIYFQHLALKLPVVLFRHNIFSYTLRMQPYGQTLRETIVKAYHRWLAMRFDYWTSQRMDVIVAQSEEMVSQLKTFTTKTPIVLIPVTSMQPIGRRNGAAPSQLAVSEARLTAVFIANFLAGANVDAVMWFVNDILPRLDESLRARYLFRFVGQAPPAEAMQRVPPDVSIEFTGYVADLDQVLADADVGFIPLRVGSGVKLKSLTILGAGLPTITTSVGVEGLAVSNGVHCIIADTADQFACGLQEVVEPSIRQSLGAAALELITRRDSEQRPTQTLDKAIQLAQSVALNNSK